MRCSCCGELTLPYGGEDVCECSPCDCGACCHEACDCDDQEAMVAAWDDDGESYLAQDYAAMDADAAVGTP